MPSRGSVKKKRKAYIAEIAAHMIYMISKGHLMVKPKNIQQSQ